MRQGIDNYIVSYMLLRGIAGFDFIIHRLGGLLGPLAEQIRDQWGPIRDVLQSGATAFAEDREGKRFNWDLAEATDVTEGMLDLKRAALDLTLGRQIGAAAFLDSLHRAKDGNIDVLLSPQATAVAPVEYRDVHPVSFTDLAADLLDSILKVLGVADRFHAIREFIAVIRAGLKMNRDIFR